MKNNDNSGKTLCLRLLTDRHTDFDIFRSSDGVGFRRPWPRRIVWHSFPSTRGSFIVSFISLRPELALLIFCTAIDKKVSKNIHLYAATRIDYSTPVSTSYFYLMHVTKPVKIFYLMASKNIFAKYLALDTNTEPRHI